jgi:transglutaminase-like putative cysteine protease
MLGLGRISRKIYIPMLVIFAFLVGLGFSYFVISFYPYSQENAYYRPSYTGYVTGEPNPIGSMLKSYHLTVEEYDERIGDLERENEILREEKNLVFNPECKTGKLAEFSEENIREAMDPGIVRNLAVSIVSPNSESPVISLHMYVYEGVKYVDDPKGEEYIATPCETILTGGGDCEDHAILLASMLESVGIDAKIIWLKGEHTFVGIQIGEEINTEIEKIQGCEDPLWLDYKGKKLLMADTSFAPCPGQVGDIYVTRKDGEWEWKEGYEVVVFDV